MANIEYNIFIQNTFIVLLLWSMHVSVKRKSTLIYNTRPLPQQISPALGSVIMEN